MKSSAQFGSGSEPIGTDRFFAESGSEIVDANGGYWLRSGLAATAASYPKAATLEHCKISGIAAVNSTSMTVLSVADNAAGVVVATFPSAGSGQILVSTDNGANFEIVSSGLAYRPTSVIYNGSRFIIVGNSSTDIRMMHSVNGTSWNGNAAQAISGGAGANTAKIAWNGTIAYGLVDFSSAAGSAFTTTDGASFTSRSAPSSVSWKSLIAGGGTFFLGWGTTTAYTTTAGASYTPVNLPTSGDMAAYLGGTWIVKNDGSPIYFTSTNLISFTQRIIPALSGNIVNFRSLSFDESRVYAGAYSSSTNTGVPCIFWTTDLISWKVRGLTDSLGNLTTWYCHAGKYFFPKGDNASTKILRTASFATADFVGAAIESTASAPHSTSGTPVLYRKLAG